MFRLALVLLLVLAPAAAAQEAPDERAAAAALAAATARFSDSVSAKDPELEAQAAFRCESVERRIPRNRRRAALAILLRNTNRVIGGILREDLGRLRTDLANVQTGDPALLSGRAAWRQIARAFMALPAARRLLRRDPRLAARRRPALRGPRGAGREST